MGLTRRLGATTTNPPLGPFNSLGSLPMVYPMMRVDAALQHHRWVILWSHLPALDPSRLAPSDQMVGLVEALRTEQAAACHEQAEARNRASAPKEPSEAFPQTAVLWRRYFGVTVDAQLPALYHTWANSTKAERRVALQASLDERVNSGLGASRVTPLATKELYELLFQARLASHTHEAEDLTKGVSLFSCGYQVGERDQDVAVQAHRFDQMLLGHTNPTLAEQETLRTKDLPLPHRPLDLPGAAPEDPYMELPRSLELGKLVSQLTSQFVALGCSWSCFVAQARHRACLDEHVGSLPHSVAAYLHQLRSQGAPGLCTSPAWTQQRRDHSKQ